VRLTSFGERRWICYLSTVSRNPSWASAGFLEMPFCPSNLCFVVCARSKVRHGLLLALGFELSVRPVRSSWGFVDVARSIDDGSGRLLAQVPWGPFDWACGVRIIDA
jgi:hypothetical protein